MKHLDLSYVKDNVTDDETFIAQLLNVFLQSLDEDIKDLENAVTKGDHAMIKRSAHKVKSSMRSLGMMELTNLLQSIEEGGDQHGDVGKIKALYAQLQAHIPTVKEEVRDYLSNQ